jgi:hypothetical protein
MALHLGRQRGLCRLAAYWALHVETLILGHMRRNSRFHHKPDPDSKPNSKLQAAYHKADKAIEDIVNLLKAA